MRYRRKRAIPVFLTLGLITMLLPWLGAPTPSRAQSVPRDKGQPFGVVAALGNRVRSDEIPTYVELMREAGVQWQREEFFWHEIQKAPGGPLDFDGNDQGFYNYDLAVSAQHNAGINLLGLLDYNPAWFKGKNPAPEEWIKDWGDFVFATVVRYGRERGQIKYWELWNEPNLLHSGYESGLYRIEDYVSVLQTGYAAVKAADPEAKVVLAGLASIWDQTPSQYNYDYPEYLRRLGDLGAFNYFDVLAIHPYRPDSPEMAPWRRDASVDFRDEMHTIDEIMDVYGHKPIWLTEMGWSTATKWPGVDEDTQGFFLVRSYILAIAHPSIEKIFWYDFRNDTHPLAAYDRPSYDAGEIQFHYGLLRRTFPLNESDPTLRKPAYLAYRTMTTMLAGMTVNEVASDGLNPDLPNLYWYRFAGVNRRVDVIWRTNTNAPSELTIYCGCREALVRYWNGQVRKLVYQDAGAVTVNFEGLGAPIYVEYDPPAREGGIFFDATGHTIRGAFADFWRRNGGLSRFGYPLTEELVEPEHLSGIRRTVQYFERARFEHFPELNGTAYDVQLGLLGNAILQRMGVDWQQLPKAKGAPNEDCMFFAESGHTLCPPFRKYWEQNGGITLIGLPLSEAFTADSSDGRQPYQTQYFERARMEAHPEHKGTSFEVEFGLVGREWLSP